MLLTILSGWLFVEKRRLVQVFPERLRKLWSDWELRGMVLVSLTLQILLIVLGRQRKYKPGTWVRLCITWSAYLMADWVATVALGVLSNKQGNSCTCAANKTNPINEELMALWAPFMLLHLGGPDTITSYALADNELWLRHFLGLGVQTGVTLYIVIMTWSGTYNWLSVLLTILILLAGVIKYVERSLALKSANREQFLDSLLDGPDPGPSYAKFMEEFALKMEEGFSVSAEEVTEVADESYAGSGDNNNAANTKELLPDAHIFFQTFKRLFVDLILSFQDRDKSQSFFQNSTWEDAFTTIEIELGFAYEAFYTKAPKIYTKRGCICRFITSSFTFIVFVLFLVAEKHNHLRTDLIITYILLVGAIILEFYAFILLLSSDRTNLWLSTKHKSQFSRNFFCFQPMESQVISCFQGIVSKLVSSLLPSTKKRWSNSLAQYNLLSFSLKRNLVPFLDDKCVQKIEKHLPFYGTLEKHLYHEDRCKEISSDMKTLIFQHFLKKSVDKKEVASLCSARGGLVFKEKNYECSSSFDWSTEKVEFDQSILIWHIATDLFYHSDDQGGDLAAKSSSKNLSDYMLYLLVMRPFMLPTGIGMIRFRDTCEEAKEFSKDKGLSSKDKDKLRAMLLKVSTEFEPTKVKGDRSKSVLFDGCKLAHQLQKWVPERKTKWEFVCNVWIEILGYAASHCRGYYHAQQLARGGELLTHIWLLMAHLGITEQFQINRGHARVKLVVK